MRRKNLFEPTTVEEMKVRLDHLRSDSERLWGKMNAAQVVAHCAGALNMASGEIRPPRKVVGRLIGWMLKPMVLGNDEPLRRNTPTVKQLLMEEERDFQTERTRLRGLIDRFAAVGPSGCTTYPHAFFGRMTPEEWAVLMYKHLDHHLRQFGV